MILPCCLIRWVLQAGNGKIIIGKIVEKLFYRMVRFLCGV